MSGEALQSAMPPGEAKEAEVLVVAPAESRFDRPVRHLVVES